jgi:hypothetical protein
MQTKATRHHFTFIGVTKLEKLNIDGRSKYRVFKYYCEIVNCSSPCGDWYHSISLQYDPAALLLGIYHSGHLT